MTLTFCLNILHADIDADPNADADAGGIGDDNDKGAKWYGTWVNSVNH